MKTSRAHRWTWVTAGVAAGLLLHGIAGWWTLEGRAQGGNTTFTTSTTTSTSFESPPACSTVGSSRTVQTVTVQDTLGPSCIGIGNRDLANPSPACGLLAPAAPPSDPSHGTAFQVPAGTSNVNGNTHTETIQCVAAVPVMPWRALLGLGGMLCGVGAWQMARRRRRIQT